MKNGKIFIIAAGAVGALAGLGGLAYAVVTRKHGKFWGGRHRGVRVVLTDPNIS